MEKNLTVWRQTEKKVIQSGEYFVKESRYFNVMGW